MAVTESNSGGALSLSDYLQVCDANRRSARIVVEGKYGRGEVEVFEGRLTGARYGDLQGEKAALALLAEYDRPYRTTSDRVTEGPGFERGIRTMLISAAQLADEGRLPRPRIQQRPSPVRWIIAASILGVVCAGGVLLLNVSSDEGDGELEVEDPASVTAAAATQFDTAPRKLSGKNPRSPRPGSALSPTIMLRLLIDEKGAVLNAETVHSRPEMRVFETAALEAARDFRFEPAMRGGEPSRAWINWPVQFAGARSVAATVRVKGSDTIGGRLFPDIVKAFNDAYPHVTVELQALGSGSGFAGLFDGSADIAMSSRPVTPAELSEAARLGIRLREFVLGYDGIALVVHESNPLNQISISDASRIFSGAIGGWDALGVNLGEIHVVSRPSYSGTHKFVLDHVLAVSGRKRFGANVTYGEKVEDVVKAVREDPQAISYVGLASAMELKSLAITAMGSEAVMLNRFTVRDSLYPLTRPLHLYTRGTPQGAVADVIRFALSDAGQVFVSEAGFVDSDVPLEAFSFEESSGGQAPPSVTRIHFRSGKHQLDVEAREALDDVAAALKAEGIRGLVVGNADTLTEGKLNREVSLKRARSVMRFLRQAGVPATKLRMEAVAGERPLASNADAAGRDANRRVDVFIIESDR